MTTHIDKTLRKIEVVDLIFKSQLSVYDPENNNPHPLILDESGHDGINGKIVSSMDIFSDVPLFDIQEFKAHVTTRFENATRLSLLIPQLREIRDNATRTLNFFNDNLAAPYMLPGSNAVVSIFESCTINQVWFGIDREEFIKRRSHKYKFSYVSTNRQLAEICLLIVGFIDDIISIKAEEPEQERQFSGHSFADHLIMDDDKKQPFADELKRTFPNIAGAKLALLLAAMEAEGLIILGNKAKLYRSLREFFGWDIGRESGLNRTLGKVSKNGNELQPYRAKIQNIYKSMK